MFGLGQRIFSAGPAVHRQETGGGSATTVNMAGTSCGLVEGTLIATAMGWRPVEAIATGDLVLTFDRGLQPVRNVERAIAWMAARQTPRAMWPLSVPAGALGNVEPLTLLPDQSVMIESDAAELVWGDPFTLIRAADLDGFRGIHRVAPQGPAQAVMLEFDHDEVAFAQHGALVFCGRGGVIGIDEVMAAGRDTYRSVDAQTARDLLDCIEFDETPAPGYAPEQQPAYAARA